MTGSVVKAGKNSWRIQIYTGRKPDGKYKRHSETVRGTQNDARKRLRQLLKEASPNGFYTMPPTSKTETSFLRGMKGKGYKVLSVGWPDFILLKRGTQPIMVEVKSDKDYLRPEQLSILALLSDYGFDVRVYRPCDNGDGIGRTLTSEELAEGHRHILRLSNLSAVSKRYPTDVYETADTLGTASWVAKFRQQLGISADTPLDEVLRQVKHIIRRQNDVVYPIAEREGFKKAVAWVRGYTVRGEHVLTNRFKGVLIPEKDIQEQVRRWGITDG
jgi:hypothetical protein